LSRAAVGAQGASLGGSQHVVQGQLADLLDAAIGTVAIEPTAMVRAAVAADVADQVADAITATLDKNGCPRATWDSHLLCGALAAVAQAMKTAEDLTRTAVIDGVTAALVTYGVPNLAAGLAGRAAADALMKAPLVRHYEDVLRAVQGLALATCPNYQSHPEVERYCLRPAESAVLSSAMQEDLASSLRHS
jgi:hypothetical protein